MRYSLMSGARQIRERNPLPLILAAACVVMAMICILLSTLFGVSPPSDWLLYAAQAFLALMLVIFTAYVVFGIVDDARNA